VRLVFVSSFVSFHLRVSDFIDLKYILRIWMIGISFKEGL